MFKSTMHLRFVTAVTVAIAASYSNAQAADKIKTEQQALDAFATAWKSDLAPMLLKRRGYEDWVKSVDAEIKAKKFSARQADFRECAKRLEGTLTEKERTQSIIHGKIDDLKRDGKCWEVEDPDDYSIFSLIAYFDGDGKLILSWIVPEG